MTEDQWLRCDDPKAMLEFLAADASERKTRLFSCACCRRVWSLLENRARRAVELAEAFADDHVTRQLVDDAWDAEGVAAPGHAVDGATGVDSHWGAEWAARNATEAAVDRELAGIRPPFSLEPAATRAWLEARLELKDAAIGREKSLQANLLRDIFGNRFRTPTFDPGWRTSSIVSVAQAMYDHRNFARIPNLAEALERAGCHHPLILDHCRQPGEHVRGCWVVDLVLGKN